MKTNLNNRDIKLTVLVFFLFFLGCSKDFGDDEKDYPMNGTIGSFIDQRDGKEYKTIQIGKQTWMTQNLNYEINEGSWKYRPSYYSNFYGNDERFGRLYNWETAKIACPDGWHLPSDKEWTEMEEYLISNGYNYDGTTSENKLAKALADSVEWGAKAQSGLIGHNRSLNNTSGFSALPAGKRDYQGEFKYFYTEASFWSSTPSENGAAWSRVLYSGWKYLLRTDDGVIYGLSVRCIKD